MRLILVAAAGFSFLAAMPLATAQSLPSKKDASDLLIKAENHKRLTEPGRPPFHFVAKIHYKSGADSLDGTYEVFWAAPDRFREEFRLGSISETEVALEDKIYIHRTIPVVTYPQWRLRMLTGLPNRDFTPIKPRVSKVYASRGGAENLTCLELAAPMKGNTYCLSSLTGELVSEDYNLAKIGTRLIEDSFIDIGTARYPGHTLSTIGNETLEVHVEELASVPRFNSYVFVPPVGASSHDWCVRPDVKKRQGEFPDWLLYSGLLAPESANMAGSYVQVAPDGHIEELATLYRDGTARAVSPLSVSHDRLAIYACNGRPIEYEAVFGVHRTK
ncbi:MAG: hypothetical protein ACRD4S_07705 [Candidatus Acidiferrales bacterium]